MSAIPPSLPISISAEDYAKAAKVLDKSGDGKISLAEIAIDTDGSKTVNRAELDAVATMLTDAGVSPAAAKALTSFTPFAETQVKLFEDITKQDLSTTISVATPASKTSSGVSDFTTSRGGTSFKFEGKDYNVSNGPGGDMGLFAGGGSTATPVTGEEKDRVTEALKNATKLNEVPAKPAFYVSRLIAGP